MQHDEIEQKLSWHLLDASIAEDCPAEERLMAYAGKKLAEDEKAVLEAHLAACGRCVHQMVGYVRPQPARRALPRKGWLLPVAASFVLLFSSIALWNQESEQADEVRTVRSLVVTEQGWQVELRQEGEDLALAWAPQPNALFYEVYVTDEEGEQIWQDRTEQLDWSPNEELSLVPGKGYFVRVDAHLPSGKYISSRHIYID